MKRTLTLLVLLASANVLFAQDSTTAPHKINVAITDRGNDKLMLQYGLDGWSGAPDSIRTKGFSRHFNIYFLIDKPFKTNPKFSVAYGIGIGSSNIFLNNTYVDIKSTNATLPFTNTDSTNHFKKYKLTTMFLEAPIELRFTANPNDPAKSLKVAIGAKVGTMLKAYTKGKDLLNKSGASVYDTKYIVKESDKKFFNGTKLAATARIGYGAFSIHADYQITKLLKENTGPEIRPWAIGITLSGL